MIKRMFWCGSAALRVTREEESVADSGGGSFADNDNPGTNVHGQPNYTVHHPGNDDAYNPGVIAQTKQWVVEAIDRLPTQAHKIYQLNREHGLSITDIATQLNVPRKRSRTH